MAIQVECPTCGHKAKAPDSAWGKKAKCPACKHTFPIPLAEGAPTDPHILQELWLYKELGEEIGPVTLEILIMLSKKGDIGPESWIKKYPDGDWTLAGKVQGLGRAPA